MLANVVGDFLRRTLVLSLREIGAAALELFCQPLRGVVYARFHPGSRVPDPAGKIFHLAANFLRSSLRSRRSALADPLGFSFGFSADLADIVAFVIFHKNPSLLVVPLVAGISNHSNKDTKDTLAHGRLT